MPSPTEFLPSEHCEQCGSSEYEDLYTGDEGYTACCNELICYESNCTSGPDGWGHIEGKRPYDPIFTYRHPYSI